MKIIIKFLFVPLMVCLFGAPLFAIGEHQCYNNAVQLNPKNAEQCLKIISGEKSEKQAELKQRLEAAHKISKLFDEFTPSDGKVYISTRTAEFNKQLAGILKQPPYNKMYVIQKQKPGEDAKHPVIGFGPQAGMLKNWLNRYKRYAPQKQQAIYDALRELDALKRHKLPCDEGSLAEAVINSYMGQSEVDVPKKPAAQRAANNARYKEFKAIWDKLTLEQRNNFIAAAINKSAQKCNVEQKDINALNLWPFADSELSEHKILDEKAQKELKSTDKVKQLHDALEAERGGSLFGGNDVRIARAVNSEMPKAISDSVAGSKLELLYPDGLPGITVKDGFDDYARYDKKTDTVAVNKQLVEDYIKQNYRNTEKFLQDPNGPKNLAAYLSSEYIYAALERTPTNKDLPNSEYSRLDRDGEFALYVTEKYKYDANFKRVLDAGKLHSKYAHDILEPVNKVSELDIDYVQGTNEQTLAEFNNNSLTALNAQKKPMELVAMLRIDRVFLQPIRGQFGAIRITSGLRSKYDNDAAGGVKDSQHLTGEAVDFVPQNKTHKLENVVVWIDDNLTFRQCILEKNTKNRWIHLALGTGNQVFRKNHTTGKSSLFYSDPYLKTVIYSK